MLQQETSVCMRESAEKKCPVINLHEYGLMKEVVDANATSVLCLNESYAPFF